ncbi:MAG: hypothetical protein NTV54_06230 [Ignavibacteriales bacterium]|nr:hypothetical protein [Ignavibacteriales bacterium]
MIADLTVLAAKAQQYYQYPTSLGGGGNSFAQLTPDADGIAILAGTAFTNNVNGAYAIKTAGNADSVVIRGVGKVLVRDGIFPTYDITVKPNTTIVQKIY